MSSLSEDHYLHHHHHHSHSPFSTKNPLKDINLPPRKLLLQRSKEITSSPRIQIPNVCEDDYEEETDPYSSDEFRMYEFKIRRCMRSRSHDWTDCPFAHPGEKARRRDPRRFHYSGNPCADFRHGTCPRGDSCEFAHGVFECWLHPARYRTHACKDGKSCTRKICFFAHTPHQLRVLPLSCSSSQCSSPSMSSPCCGFCHSMASSPTSTLMGLNNLSPPLSPRYSPPISPSTNTATGGYSLLQRFNEAASGTSFSSSKPTLAEYMNYKKALLDLVNSLDNMNLSSLDFEETQTQFFLSPTATTAATSKPVVMSGGYFGDQDGLGNNNGPDLDWVDELIM